MRHILKLARWSIVWIFLGILVIASVQAKSQTVTKNDHFVGSWLLFVHSNGDDVPEGSVTISLKITQKDAFYTVKLEIPDEGNTPGSDSNDYWTKFQAQSIAELNNLTSALAVDKYSGKYLLDDDRKSITHLNAAVTFQYKAAAGMICEKGLGCFKKGNQNKLIQRRKVEQEAQAKATAEAMAEAEARKPRELANKTIKITAKEDNLTEFTLSDRNRVDFDITVDKLDIGMGGAQHMVRAIILDENGYTEWKKTKYKFSFGNGDKDTTMVTGPCSALMKREVRERATGSCELGAGTYYIAFYDAAPGWTSQLHLYNFLVTFSVSASLLVEEGNSPTKHIAENRSEANIKHDIGAALGTLASIRSALQVFYGDNGVFPSKLEELTLKSRYLSQIPYLHLPGHSNTNSIKYVNSNVIDPKDFSESGGYVYYGSSNNSATWGTILLDCTHKREGREYFYKY